MDNYRRAQRDRVLREKRGINEEQVLLFALGRKDFILPDIDTDASKMASKRQILDKMRKTKRHEILTERRKMETLMESHSAASAELQKAILISLKKLGDLVPEIRRRNKDVILNKRRNINAELELEEVLQETPRQVTSSRSESLEAPKLQRAAAQKRIRNSRDWVVQCRRRLIYAKSIINGNGALRRSRSSAENISIPENKQLSVSPPNTSLDTDGPADGIDKTPYDTTDIPAQSLDDASLQISDPRELVHTDQPIDFSNLEFWKVLGKGNYGKVILASDPVSEGLLAIKIMDKSSCEDLISTELEVLRMAAGCPYLMTMRAFRETPTEYEIAMDYMAGGDLFGHMKDSMMFNTKTIRLFAAEMVCGLQFLHERGVIHSDLKPENILLQDTGHIKISDFGLAAMNVFEGDIVEYTAGTKGYIAPEVMDGEGYNHLADSFSFGVILYMMTVGDWPFYTRGTMDEYHQSLYDDIPSFPPGICCHAMDIIKRLLCKTPSARSAITSSIRSHPFFYSIDWSDVESGRADPPFPYYYQEY